MKKMRIDELLDKLDSMVDKSWVLPGGKCVLDAAKVRDIIDDLRLNLPKEVPQAKAIVADRMEIIKNAKSEATDIIISAEEKANVLISQDEIVRQAQDRANLIIADTQQKSKEMKKAAADFSDNLLKQAEENIATAYKEIKQARQALKSPPKQ